MEVITAQSFGKWMHVFQTVVARDVPQVRISPLQNVDLAMELISTVVIVTAVLVHCCYNFVYY